MNGRQAGMYRRGDSKRDAAVWDQQLQLLRSLRSQRGKLFPTSCSRGTNWSSGNAMVDGGIYILDLTAKADQRSSVNAAYTRAGQSEHAIGEEDDY